METLHASPHRAGFVKPVVALVIFGLFLVGGLCTMSTSNRSSSKASSLAQIERAMQGVPSYSVTVADASKSGNFLSSYGLQYAIEQQGEVALTDWFSVDEQEYNAFAPKRGMTVLTYKDGVRNATVAPPGYQHVGDPQYGSWERDSSGNSFWVFYGQYRLMSDMMGMALGGRMSQNDYNNYRRTSTTPPPPPPGKAQERNNFYNSRMKREAAANTAFASRVNQRIGRTAASTSTRSRGASAGK